MRRLFLAAVLVFFFLSGCRDDCMDPQFPEELRIRLDGVDLFIEHSTNDACCGEIEVVVEDIGHAIVISETNVGKRCMCVCGYLVETVIQNIEHGERNLILHGLDGTILYEHGFSVPGKDMVILPPSSAD